MSGRTLAYEPARRAEVFALLDRVRGYELDPAEFDWWFDGNPVGPRTIALAEEDERVVGVLGASHYRAVRRTVARRSRRCRSGPSPIPSSRVAASSSG